jgi:hypothetical protein
MQTALAHRRDPKATGHVEAAAQARAQRTQLTRECHKRVRETQFRSVRKAGGDSVAGRGTTPDAGHAAATHAPVAHQHLDAAAVKEHEAAQTGATQAFWVHKRAVASPSLGLRCRASVAQALAWARARCHSRCKDWLTALDVCIATRPGDARSAALTPSAFALAIDALCDMDFVCRVGGIGSVLSMRMFVLESSWLPAAAEACRQLLPLVHDGSACVLRHRLGRAVEASERYHEEPTAGAGAGAIANIDVEGASGDTDTSQAHFSSLVKTLPTLYPDALVLLTLILRIMAHLTQRYVALRDLPTQLPATEVPVQPAEQGAAFTQSAQAMAPLGWAGAAVASAAPGEGAAAAVGSGLMPAVVSAADADMQVQIEATPAMDPATPECKGAYYQIMEGAVRAGFPQLLTSALVLGQLQRRALWVFRDDDLASKGTSAAGFGGDEQCEQLSEEMELEGIVCLGNVLHENDRFDEADIPGLAPALASADTASLLCDALYEPNVSVAFLREVLFCVQTIVNGTVALERLLTDDVYMSTKLVQALLYTTRVQRWRPLGKEAMHTLADFSERIPCAVGIEVFAAILSEFAACIRSRPGLEPMLLEALLRAMANNLRELSMSPDFERIQAIFNDDATYAAITALNVHPRPAVNVAAQELLNEMEGACDDAAPLEQELAHHGASKFPLSSGLLWHGLCPPLKEHDGAGMSSDDCFDDYEDEDDDEEDDDDFDDDDFDDDDED